MNFDLKDVELLLLPGKCPFGSPLIPTANILYSRWHSFWQEEFTKAGILDPLKSDDFMRQDVILSLWHRDRLAAFHLYSFFDLEQQATRGHRYFSIYDSEVLSQLWARRATRLMSMEYLSVEKEWRKSKVGIPLAAVLFGIGTKILAELDLHAAIGPTKNEAKVNNLALAFGSVCLKKDIICVNYTCDLMACFRESMVPYPKPEVNVWVEQLWSRRKDPLNLLSAKASHLTPEIRPEKSAA